METRNRFLRQTCSTAKLAANQAVDTANKCVLSHSRCLSAVPRPTLVLRFSQGACSGVQWCNTQFVCYARLLWAKCFLSPAS